MYCVWVSGKDKSARCAQKKLKYRSKEGEAAKETRRRVYESKGEATREMTCKAERG